MRGLYTPYRFGTATYDLSVRTYVMGILNVTPDSFSDGGTFLDAGRAVGHAHDLIAEGADFIDVGGESTRPGAETVSAEEELKRILPVVARLVRETTVPISVDTYKPEVAAAVLDQGAVIINDISGFHFNPSLAEVVGRYKATAILMHIRGTPGTMQQEPVYENLIGEICSWLREGIAAAEAAGVEQIIVDPGVGFGKTVGHNLEILRRLEEFHECGYPVLVGTSRKAFIGKILDLPVDDRLEGTAATVALAVSRGANIVRVHDVKAMKRVTRMADAILRGIGFGEYQ